MKRILALLLALSMLFALTACGGKDKNTLTDESAEETTITPGSTTDDNAVQTENDNSTETEDVDAPEDSATPPSAPVDEEDSGDEQEDANGVPTDPPEPAEPTTVATTKIAVSKTSVTLDIGNSETITATVSPSNATDKAVQWSTSDSSIATVNNGKITAVKEGTATITAKASGGQTATCKVTVNKAETKPTVVATTKIAVSKTSVTLDIGNSETITATVSPSNATDKTVQWSTSDSSVATVNNGKITAVKEGTATITAKASGGQIATCKVTVNKAETKPTVVATTKIAVSKTSVTLDIGNSETITATVSPSNATDKTVQWSTSDSSVATVNNGKITAVKEGTATITAKASGGQTATCKVTVNKKEVPVATYTGYDIVSANIGYENEKLLTRMFGKYKGFQIGDTLTIRVNMSDGSVPKITISNAVCCTCEVSGNTIKATFTSSGSAMIDFEVETANGTALDYHKATVVDATNLANDTSELRQQFIDYGIRKGMRFVASGADIVKDGYTFGTDDSGSITGYVGPLADDYIRTSGNSDWLFDILDLLDCYASMGCKKFSFGLTSWEFSSIGAY